MGRSRHDHGDVVPRNSGRIAATTSRYEHKNVASFSSLILLSRVHEEILSLSLSLFVVSALITILATNPAFAAGKKKKEAPVPKAPIIASVTPTAITVTEDKTTKTFTITQFTEINVNGQRATVADVKPGMTVNVTIGMDPSKASRIVASGK